MWLLHLAANNYFGWCKPCKTFRSHVIHPSPFYVIIQVPSIFQRIQSCTPRPSTYPSNTIFYENKCLDKRSNWSMFPPKNRLLIYSLNHCLETHLNISDKSWEYLLHHPAAKSNSFKKGYYTRVSWSIVVYTCGFLWVEECIYFPYKKNRGQALIWVLCLMLIITVYWYALFIIFYLTDKDALIAQV